MNYAVAVCPKCGAYFTVDADMDIHSCRLCGNRAARTEFKCVTVSVEMGRELYLADCALYSNDRKAARKHYKNASKLDKRNPYPLFGAAFAKHGIKLERGAAAFADGKPQIGDGAYKKALKLIGGANTTAHKKPPKASDLKDFKIKDERLIDYRGEGGDVVIPDCVKKITSVAFLMSDNVKSVYIPRSVVYIDDQAFTAMPPIERIDVDLANKRYKTDSGCLIDTEYNTLIRATPGATIPSYLRKIGEYSFEKCTELTSISIPEGITRIGEYAFGACESLERVDIPASLTHVDDGIFSYCPAIKEFNVSPYNPVLCEREGALYDKAQDRVLRGGADGKIPEGCKTLGTSSYDGGQFERLYIPSSVIDIGDYALDGCDKLKSIEVDNANKVYAAKNNCLILRDSRTLVTVADGFKIPSDGSVRVIGKNAFRYAELSVIDIPPTVVKISEDAFADSDVTNMILPHGLTEIGDNAFNCCAELESITLSDTLKFIGEEAFGNCEKLKRIVIPESMEYISDDVFFGCDALEEVVFEDPCGWLFDGDGTPESAVDARVLSDAHTAAELVKDGRAIFKERNHVAEE